MENKIQSNVKSIIFDFDGTIADTLSVGITIINRNSAHFGIKPINPKDIHRLKKLPLMTILKEFEIALTKVPYLLKIVRVELANEIDNIKPFENMPTLLHSLKKGGYELGILSSNSTENINKFLKNTDLEIFDFVWSENTLFGKQRALKKILKIYELNPQETLYIGDEVRDIQGAKKAGVLSGAVTWGYNDKDLLLKQKPDLLITDPADAFSL